MPQHLVPRPSLHVWPALLALAGFVLAIAPGAALAATAADAARTEVELLHGVVAGELEVVRIGGDGDWDVGTVTIPAGHPAAQEDEPRVFVYVALRDGTDWTAAVEGTTEFAVLAAAAIQALDGTPSAELLATALAASTGDGSAELSLPWAVGDTWRMTGGPHHFHGGSSRPLSSLDFAGPTAGASALVRAARGGIVVRPCANMVQVRHADGWTTSYYHLRDIRVAAGESVARGEPLGYTSTRAGCGGSATGPHVHFSLLRDGRHVNIRGHVIGGWSVQEGNAPYTGCLVKDGAKRCAPSGSVYNDGSVGTQPAPALQPTTEMSPYVARTLMAAGLVV